MGNRPSAKAELPQGGGGSVFFPVGVAAFRFRYLGDET